MWIKRVVLTNFGKHDKLEVEFTNGLNGIFGPNGCGKSTIVDGVYAAISNDWSRFYGVKTDNIRDTSNEKAESSILIEAESLGIGWSLFRGLRPNKSELRIDGQPKGIHKAGEIEHALKETLGVDMKLLDRYVFVPQWSMFSFLSETEGERAKTFQHLCGTGKAEQIYQAIGKMLDDEEFPTEVIDNTDEIRARLSRAQADLAKAEKKAKAARKGLLSDEKEEKAKGILAKRKEYERLAVELDELTKTEKEAELSAKSRKRTLASRRELVTELEAGVKELRPGADEARAQLTQLDEIQKRLDRKAELEKRLGSIRDPKEPKRPKGYMEDPDERENRAKTIMENMQEVAKMKGIVRQFDGTGVAECSLCGTKTDEIPVESYRNSLPVVEGTLKKLEDAQRRDDAFDEKLAAYRQESASREDRRAAIREELGTLEGVAELDVSPEALQQTITDFEEQEENLEKAREMAADASESSVRADTKLEGIQKRIDSNQKAAKKNAVKDVSVERAEKALEKHAAAKVEVAKFDERVSGLKAEVEEDQELLEKLEAQMSRQRKAIKFAKKLKGIRKVMHRKNLPRVVAQENLEDMEDDINEHLAHFGDPFWIEASDDLSFNVHFPGEPPRPAARNSGGQKVILAVAFRAAVSSLFSDELGMLSLDEPAAGLDEANVDFLAEALARFGAEVRGKRQVIMVTHANSLRPSFDKVIEVGAA